MTMLGLGRARRGLNFLLNQVRGRVAILLYHRVVDHVPDPQLLCVSPGNFEEHLQYLRRSYHTISLSSLAESLHNGQVPRKAVVITFDDGYVDNLHNAFPLLDHYGIPATVFVSSGYVGKQEEMISDALERILLQTESLPAILELRIRDETNAWFLGESPAQPVRWDVTMGVFPTPRHKCYYELHRLLRSMDAVQRQEIMRQLAEWAGGAEDGRPDRRVMNALELKEISRSGLIEIGAHTVNHIMLAQQPVEVQRNEIEGSKRQLEQILERPVTSFAYPYGGKGSVCAKTIQCVQEAGFDLACDNIPGVMGKNANLFALPRFLVRDWDGNEFRRRLQSAFLS